MTSLWRDVTPPTPSDERLEPGSTYDVVVVGAGLTGLATAVMLTRAGLSVAVLEARSVGAAATGNTTAKLSLLHGGALADIRTHTSRTVLRAYLAGNREGQSWLLQYLRERSVPVQYRDAITYTASPDGIGAVNDEREAAREAGLPVTDARDIGLPFASYAAIRLADQAQFNPMDVLNALASDVRRGGGTVVEKTRVTDVRVGEPSTVHTEHGFVTGAKVILATGVPILDRGLYFAKVKPKRSYALAFRVPDGPLPQGMYFSIDSPSRSLRTAPVSGGERLIVGGNGHTVGRGAPTQARVDDLEAWCVRHFPGAERTHAWSAQDYESANRIPFVGWMPRTGSKVYLATGFNKWGMTNAAAAALSLSADILGGTLPWAQTLHHRVTRPVSLGSGAATAASVGGTLAASWTAAELHPLPERSPEEGDGVVGNDNFVPTAVSTVAGVVCRLSAICPHLGGIVTWNNAERSWDCPLHGSRFDSTGRLLEGPATRDLSPRSP